MPKKITDFVKITNEPGVYAINKNTKTKELVVDTETLKSYGQSSTDVKEADPEELNDYKTIGILPLNDDTVVKTEDDPTIYVIKNGKKQPVASPTALIENGYNFEEVQTIPKQVLGIHPRGEMIK